MPTLLDDVQERHEGAEPRVLTACVQQVLLNLVRPDADDGASVSMLADRAGVSTRTVYRVLNPPVDKLTISLDLADRLCLAADVHLDDDWLVN